jgi:uncharacterized protein involved in outer membrane biogenesis
MASIRKFLVGGTALLLILAGVVAVLASNFDWNLAKPWLSRHVADALGRPFNIDGDLSLHWEAPEQEPSDWRRLLPWPHLSATRIRLGNPAWASKPEMLRIERVHFSINPWPLLDRKIEIPRLEADNPVLDLERTSAGQDNWSFKRRNTAIPWTLELQQLVLAKGELSLADAVHHIDANADIDTLDNSSRHSGNYGIRWQLRGKFNREAVYGSGQAGAVLALRDETMPYPLLADVRLGKIALHAEGTLTRPADLAAMDMRLRLSAPSMALLYPVIGVVLPETPAFNTEGRLKGRLNRHGGDWTYEKFSGKVGSSDLAGTLLYQSARDERSKPELKGTLVSELLRFEDLGPLIGADSNASKIKRDAAPVQPKNKVLPVEHFRPDRWSSINADVQFTGKRILREKYLPIDNISTRVLLNDSVIKLQPLVFGVAGGSFRSDIALDGRGETIQADILTTARHLKLKQLFPGFEAMQASLGEINAQAALQARGDSIASLLAHANGQAQAVIDQGSISKLLLEEMGLNIGNVVLVQLAGDRQIHINCLVSDFSVKEGVMQTRRFVVDTDDSLTDINGQISLAQEQLQLTIRPHSKGLRLVTLRTPIYVSGPFKSPDVSLDKGILALRAGGAAALALLAPVAALLPLANLENSEDSACRELLTLQAKPPTLPGKIKN